MTTFEFIYRSATEGHRYHQYLLGSGYYSYMVNFTIEKNIKKAIYW
jgi:hypothetical protein